MGFDVSQAVVEESAYRPMTPLSYPKVIAPKLAMRANKYVRKLYTSFGVGLSSMIPRAMVREEYTSWVCGYVHDSRLFISLGPTSSRKSAFTGNSKRL